MVVMCYLFKIMIMFSKIKIRKLKTKIKDLEFLLIRHNVYEKEKRLQEILNNKNK
jgi:hypothetical protein